MPINQITSNNTFQQWLAATQALIQTANTLTNGGGATFVANTILQISGTGSSLNVKTGAEVNSLFSNNITVTNLTSQNSNLQNVNVSKVLTIDGVNSSLNVKTTAEVNNLFSNNITVTNTGINTAYVQKTYATDIDVTGNVRIIGSGKRFTVFNQGDINELFSNTINVSNVNSSGIIRVSGANTSLNVDTTSEINLLFSNVSIVRDTLTTNILNANDVDVSNGEFLSINTASIVSDIFRIDSGAYFTEAGGGVYLAFDSNDYVSYDRSLNKLNIFINAKDVISVDSNSTFIINGNTHVQVPVGTTAQRDAAADLGAIRYNTTTGSYEGYSAFGWSSIGGGFSEVLSVTTDTTMTAGKLYVYTSNVALTLPESPTVGNFIGISNQSGYKSSNVARNSEKIMGLEENMLIDSLNAGFTLYYTGSTKGWIIL